MLRSLHDFDGVLEPDEPVIVFCVLAHMKHIDTARPGACADCGQAIWLAPSTLAMLEKYPPPRGRAVCLDCAPGILAKNKADGNPTKFGVIKGQAEEVIEHFKKEDAARNN